MSICMEANNLIKVFGKRTVVDGDSLWKTVVLLVAITLLCSVVSVKTFHWEYQRVLY